MEKNLRHKNEIKKRHKTEIFLSPAERIGPKEKIGENRGALSNNCCCILSKSD
jgi:hypothetical protein